MSSNQTDSTSKPPNRPLGTSGDLRRRLLLHHMPLAVASALVLVIFMSLPLFDTNAYPHADIFSGTFPQGRGGGGQMDHGGHQAMDHGAEAGAMRHGRDGAGPMDHGEWRDRRSADERQRRTFMRQITFATGYLALGLLALTLLIGPANLLLRRQTPISNYLSRDVGMWAAIGSAVHTIFALQVHGSGRIRDFLAFFVAPDGSPLLNSFGLGNWTGLAALVIVVGLFAISSDAALRKL